MKKNIKKTQQREITLDGLMTFGKLGTGLRTADFECCEDDVQMEAFVGRFKVQGMRDGNVYMEELPKRIRNRKPLNRQTNSTLSLGRDGYYYVRFRLPENEVTALPRLLVNESSAIAQWVLREVLGKV